MVNNKQVNLWRGDSVPPTIYHIWIKDNSQLLLFDGTAWVVFLDNVAVVDSIKKIIERLDKLEADVKTLNSSTVNGKKIITNPVLNGKDILIEGNGNFVIGTNTATQATLRLDELLTTQIIE